MIDLGLVTAYAYAVAGGYTGTEQEFEELLGNIATDLEDIENLTVTATTLPAGSQATASYSNGTLTLGIPRGNTGATGATGQTGPVGPTGNGIASITLTSTVGAVHTYTITYTNGQTTTFDVTDGEVTTASLTATLADYARIDGYYEDLTAGYAENLISNVFEEDSVPYNFRTSGGSLDIGSFENDTVVGGTVAFNQMVQTSSSSVTVTSGHKYYSSINGTRTVALSNGSAISINDGTKDNVIDLTLLFGTTIADYIYTLETGQAGAGVAWFKKLFPKSYYPYNAGELMHVQTSGHKTVGFNQWDEEWELGDINGTTGANQSGTDRIRSKNYIPAIPNTSYYFKHSNVGRLFYYDKDYNFISNQYSGVSSTYTIPSNCYYIRFVDNNATYNHDICINLHWDGERDGEYEAYTEHTYPLDSSLVLRGKPTLDSGNNLKYIGDTYNDNGTVTRKFIEVDLGTISWQTRYTGTTNKVLSTTTLPQNYIGYPYELKMLADKYMQINGVAGAAELSTPDSLQRGFYIYTNSSSPLTATVYIVVGVSETPSGKMVYELATPTTETANPFQNPQAVSNWGTEEYIDGRTVAIPVGHNTEYPADLKAKVETSPNPPDADGDYLVRHVDGENVYISLASNATITDILNRLSALEG